MEPDDHARRRLAEALDERRLRLRLKWAQVAERAQMSIAHLTRIRRGEAAPSALAKANLEVALSWPPGSIDAIMSGHAPADTEGEKPRPTEPAEPERHGQWPAEAEAGALESLQQMAEILQANRAALLEQQRVMEEQRREIAKLHKKVDQILRDRKGV